MAPIHDTDVAKERWAQAEWREFELWEKVEQREAKKRRLWVWSAIVAFALISAVPPLMDCWPKWKTLSAARGLARTLNGLKKEAAIQRSAFRLTFEGGGSLAYRIEKLKSCDDPQAIVVRSESLMDDSARGQFVLMSRSQSEELGIPGIIESFCYDPIKGATFTVAGEEAVRAPISSSETPAPLRGFAIIPVKDLTEKRVDRLSVVLTQGEAAEISFN